MVASPGGMASGTVEAAQRVTAYGETDVCLRSGCSIAVFCDDVGLQQGGAGYALSEGSL